MSIDLESAESEFVLIEDEELNQLCAEHQMLKVEIALLKSKMKELEKETESRAEQIQNLMGPHKAVKTSFGFTAQWVHKSRVAYKVAAKEWDQWECRSPF